MNEIRRGWRYFVCDECGMRWKSPSRDCFSPSGEDCECGCFARAYDREVDESLQCDKWGNLTIPWDRYGAEKHD